MIIIIIKMTVDLHRSAACRTGLSERGSDHPRGPSDQSSSPWSSQTAPCTFAAERTVDRQEDSGWCLFFCGPVCDAQWGRKVL